jgi:hypothetical protein
VSFRTRLEEGAIVFLSKLNSERAVSQFDTSGGDARTSVRTMPSFCDARESRYASRMPGSLTEIKQYEGERLVIARAELKVDKVVQELSILQNGSSWAEVRLQHQSRTFEVVIKTRSTP